PAPVTLTWPSKFAINDRVGTAAKPIVVGVPKPPVTRAFPGPLTANPPTPGIPSPPVTVTPRFAGCGVIGLPIAGRTGGSVNCGTVDTIFTVAPEPALGDLMPSFSKLSVASTAPILIRTSP